MIKLILSDMDGTLLDDDGQVPEGFDTVIGQLRERGVIFAPCSGRQYFSLLDSFKGYEDEFLFLAENGTMVRYRGQELFSSAMRRETGLQVLATAQSLPGTYQVYCGKQDAYILEEQHTPELQAELSKYYTHSAITSDFEHLDDELIKVSVFDPTGHAAATIYPLLAKYDGPLQVVLSSDYWVDVMNFGINKGIAIQQVQKKLHIAPNECAAFGDYMNDAEMMSSVYYSFAMANAHPKIKELARFETASNQEHGVLKGIQWLMDQKLC
ncbi:MAG: HAD family phosphatase [Selenomonas sp.]|nr:HAD family phosphatase [Selenomonas sp.]